MLPAQSHVQRKVAAHPPVVLKEERVVVRLGSAVGIDIEAAAARKSSKTAAKSWPKGAAVVLTDGLLVQLELKEKVPAELPCPKVLSR